MQLDGYSINNRNDEFTSPLFIPVAAAASCIDSGCPRSFYPDLSRSVRSSDQAGKTPKNCLNEILMDRKTERREETQIPPCL